MIRKQYVLNLIAVIASLLLVGGLIWWKRSRGPETTLITLSPEGTQKQTGQRVPVPVAPAPTPAALQEAAPPEPVPTPGDPLSEARRRYGEAVSRQRDVLSQCREVAQKILDGDPETVEKFKEEGEGMIEMLTQSLWKAEQTALTEKALLGEEVQEMDMLLNQFKQKQLYVFDELYEARKSPEVSLPAARKAQQDAEALFEQVDRMITRYVTGRL